jgi:hypothetical protein
MTWPHESSEKTFQNLGTPDMILLGNVHARNDVDLPTSILDEY